MLKSAHKFDITILTDRRYVNPLERNAYIDNVLLEDRLIAEALRKKGLRVTRTNWDNANFNWKATRAVLFRTTWDYFDRFDEFNSWLKRVSQLTHMINSYEQIKWNIDKHYLLDLERSGIPITETSFIDRGQQPDLLQKMQSLGWKKTVLKPAIAGGARHTYLLDEQNVQEIQDIFSQLNQSEDFLLQPFQHQVLSKGEVTFMIFGGRYSHAVLKRARPGDFRVQDDFGGTVHPYEASQTEIQLAEATIASLTELPAYARVDVMWDDNNMQRVSEVELIEPELWLRTSESAPELMADAVIQRFQLLP